MCIPPCATSERSILDTWVTVYSEHMGNGDAKMELVDYIEVFYDQRRRRSTLGQISPAGFERQAMTHAA